MLLSRGDAELLTQVRAAFSGAPPARLAVAVSGGGDSVALMQLLRQAFDPSQVQIEAATVDHGLRPEAAAEAAAAGEQARALGIPHSVLLWRDHAGGNLQDNARRARFRLLADWARGRAIGHVALGHTADDQAETVLMRLARAAGADGLAAMRPARVQHGVTFLRPMLSLTRAELRDYLLRYGIGWAEDPSNADDSYDRVKARQILPQLAPLGITAPVLAEVAANMARSRDALDFYTHRAACEIAEVRGGAVAIDPAGFRDLPDEIARRLLIRAIRWIAGGDYPPRRAPVAALAEALREGRAGALGGCLMVHRQGRAWICREPEAVAGLRVPAGGLWDNRWRLCGGVAQPGEEIAALGESGLAQCPDWRAEGLPRAAQLAGPALWRGDTLIAAPLAGAGRGWSATLEDGEEGFASGVLSH
ncbi:tRNA lysidine(34) synthetase TilS [Seohaeicola zhoushanensis]|uniref:tRNA(Ile)-lysidine synthase n=1 Tax=Seohaeicola zhoushanensis TaxID=1569283 RepID=A0A8J3GV53_9RHOB|nr:tRNA lysidine(34) synthetase TilS [Seohaeicola zhoushanensis]GHF41983.1 tRNA(Ile)-lysidine synthase [Seohaeicola zhoushanensis]